MKIKDILKSVLDFFKGKKIIIEKNNIENILPHRGRMLLLDKVIITRKKIIGEFLVTDQVCEGHNVFNGKPIFKGSDLLDMAAQTLGVWIAQNSELGKEKMVVREYGKSKFRKPILPGEILNSEILTEKITIQKIENSGMIIIRGKKILIKVKEERRAEISSVELVLFLLVNVF